MRRFDAEERAAAGRSFCSPSGTVFFGKLIAMNHPVDTPPDARKHLLILASTYPRWSGDPEPGFVHELARRLTTEFRVTVLCPHAAGAKQVESMDGVGVIRYRYAPERLEKLVNDGGVVANLKRTRWKYLLVPSFILGQAWLAWRLCRRERVDVIHAHWLIPQGLIAALLQSIPGHKVPFVVTSHGADLYALKGRWLDGVKRFVGRRAAYASVVSNAMREPLRALGVDDRKISVQPMGVDLVGRFSPDPTVPRSSRELLFVGRLVEKKGLRHLISALPVVLEQVPDAFLTIAGFGPEELALRQQVRDLGLEDHVRFVGAVPQCDLPAMYRRSALFVAPFVQAESGDQEGLGLVLVEAIGCGCPVLAGNLPAVSDVLGHAPNLTVNPSDVEALGARILATLSCPLEAQFAVSALRSRVSKKFGWAPCAASYAGLLTRASHTENPQ